MYNIAKLKDYETTIHKRANCKANKNFLGESNNTSSRGTSTKHIKDSRSILKTLLWLVYDVAKHVDGKSDR